MQPAGILLSDGGIWLLFFSGVPDLVRAGVGSVQSKTLH